MSFKKIIVFVGLVAAFTGCSSLNDNIAVVSANKCRACHALPPADLVHTAHVDTMHYSCEICHKGASDSLQTVSKGHSLGVVQVHISSAFDPNGTATYDPVKMTCNMIYCHGNFVAGNLGTVKTTDMVTGCSFCHATPPVDRMHSAHIDTMHYACVLCHIGAGETQLSADAKKLHVNGIVDVQIKSSFDTTGKAYYDNSKKTCNLVYCHGAVVPKDSGIVNIQDTVTGCGFCHDLNKLRLVDHHDSLKLPIKTFYKCGLCHPGYDLATKKTNDALHINGHIDVAGCDQCHELRTWIRK